MRVLSDLRQLLESRLDRLAQAFLGGGGARGQGRAQGAFQGGDLGAGPAQIEPPRQKAHDGDQGNQRHDRHVQPVMGAVALLVEGTGGPQDTLE
jgi:hypothetical protein